MMKLFFSIILLFFANAAHGASPGDVVINEIAWMGTVNSHFDEWIELYNNTSASISIGGWVLRSTTDDTPNITLEGSIPPLSFFLLERTDDTSVSDVPANQIYTGDIKNSGEHIELLDAQGVLIDNINAFGSNLWDVWGGDNDTKQTMERNDPKLSGSDPDSWGTSVNPGGTPKAQNSLYQPTEPAPEPAPETQPAPNPETDPAPPPASPAQADDSTPDSEPTAQDSTSTEEIAASTVSYPDSIFINEIMPFPVGPDDLHEWIEITNESDLDTDISFWAIKDTAGVTNPYIFPNGSTISARSFLVLSRPTSKITLNNDKDGLGLIRPDGNVAQVFYYESAPKGSSYARAQDAWNWTIVPTPGSANILPTPPATPEDGPPPIISTQSVDPLPTKSLSNRDSIQPSEPTIDDLKEVVRKYKEIEEDKNGALTFMEKNEDAERAKQIASAVDAASGNKDKLVIFGAVFLALFSGVFIFLLKKRTRQGGLNEP